MQFTFYEVEALGTGKCPDVLHYWDNEAQLLYIDPLDGKLYAKTTSTPNGDWVDRTLGDVILVGPDDGMTMFKIDSLSAWGAFGSYVTGNKQKMILYEFQYSLDEFLSEGKIMHTMDTPVSSFTLTLENPKDAWERYDYAVVGELETLMKPGSKVVFRFRSGDSFPYDMGVFYVDRSSFKVGELTAAVEGRNRIGKVLKDQTMNMKLSLTKKNMLLNLAELFEHAGLASNDFLIQTSVKENSFRFKPDTDILSAIQEVIKLSIDWQIGERVDGKIVVGASNYAGFVQNSMYTFHRGHDIFSREIAMDDQYVCSQVCVHDSDFKICVFKEVAAYIGWDVKSKKTLFVQIPEGMSSEDATLYAENLAERMESMGKIEKFTGPFRPYLLTGDGATIVEEDGTSHVSLGLITEVSHRFGKAGMYTDFTVDSGGRLGSGRLTDYIGKIDIGGSRALAYYDGDPPPVANANTYTRKGASTFVGTADGTTQVVSEIFCTPDSLVIVNVTSGASLGVWSVVAGQGSFTVTSTQIETADVGFDYYILRAV